MDLFSFEIGGIIISFFSGVIGLITWGYKNVYKPAQKLMRSHEELVKSVEIIKAELTPNGGSSIKDCINRIEKRQLIIDERSKAIFFNHSKPIFEVDAEGNVLWANAKFHKLMGNRKLEGLDWINIIDEPHRKDFLDELWSCGKIGRELKFQTSSTKNKLISFNGFPYRCVKDKQNYGFLIYLLMEN